MFLWSGIALADELALVLHDPSDRSGPSDRCDAEVCSSLLHLIEGATTSIDFAFYGFRGQTPLFEAMKDAEARGVRIRGVVDMDVTDTNYYESTRAWMAEFPDTHTDWEVDRLSAANQRSWASTRYACPRPAGFLGPLQCLAIDLGDRCYLSAHVSREPITYSGQIMHDKFLVVDSRSVWTGSTNLSDSCTGGYNANLVMVVHSAVVASWYRSEFEQMYDRGLFHDTKQPQAPMRARLSDDVSLEVLFSPQHDALVGSVEPLIRQAQRSIDVAVFYLTHKGIAQDLVDARRRGVSVRVILDATGAANEYTKHEVLRLAGIPVKIEDFGGKMHAKSAVIDGEILIGGSMNWTNAGTDENDENTLLVRSKRHAAQYTAWFEQVWSEIPERWTRERPDAESRDSDPSCSDGVDNDFDERVDADDPGCGANPPPVSPLPPYEIVPKPDGGRCTWALSGGRRE